MIVGWLAIVKFFPFLLDGIYHTLSDCSYNTTLQRATVARFGPFFSSLRIRFPHIIDYSFREEWD